MKSLITFFAAGALALVSCKSNEHDHHDHDHAAVCERDGVAMVEETGAEPAKAQVAIAHFGAALKLSDAEAVGAEKVIASPAEYRDKYVRIVGQVGDVCPKRGCWLRVVGEGAAAGGENIFIKFRDPASGMLIPLEAIGKKVTVEGTLKVGQISEAAARHFKEDAKASREEIEKIVGPQKQMVLAGAGVVIEGVERQ